MNMNEQEWNEIWDEEPDEDDEFNDFGSDVDANNDETFDNAAEWNEDEHEELIARDSILSHTIRNNNNNSSSNRHANNNNNNTNTSRTAANLGPVHHANFASSTNSNNHNIRGRNSNTSSSAANNGDRAAVCYLAMVQGDASTWESSNADKGLFPIQERSHIQAPCDGGSSADMYNVLRNAERYIQSMSQQERSAPEQSQNFRGLINQNINPPNAARAPQLSGPMGERILTVDELEKQLLKTSLNSTREQQPRPHMTELSKRAGWSPFGGGKELFTSQEQQLQSQLGIGGPNIVAHGQMPTSLSLEQQRQIFIQQQQHMLQQQQLLQQMTLMKQHQIQTEQRLMAQNPQCFTVEELERQLLANRSAQNQQVSQSQNQDQEQNQNQSETHETIRTNTRIQAVPERPNKIQERQQPNKIQERQPNSQHNNHRRREGERSDRPDYDRDGRENRLNHKDRRDNHRDNNHREHRQRPRGPMIVPPQVQLSVIEKGKKLHPLASTQGDEFLQDRVPTMKDGFLMKRHSAVARNKPNHDGVLNEKERKWLIQIQEKIQADYDDNMDQDYYYLLYFNRTSKPNENAQKSKGPGVPDRRFIPRERLLYDSST